jgi:hypothetical protein
MRGAWVASLAMALVACGDRTGRARFGAPADASTIADASTTSDGARVDVGGVDTFAPDVATASCVQIEAALAAEVSPTTGSCTTVVRLDYGTLQLLSYRMLCGPYAPTALAGAFQHASADTGLSLTGCNAGQSISGNAPRDEYVFYQSANARQCDCCGDGWLASTSARTGITALGSAIDVGGAPHGLKVPTGWRPASELGAECAGKSTMPPTRGWDVAQSLDPLTPPPALDAMLLGQVAAVIEHTVLLDALASVDTVFDAVALKYAGTLVTPDAEVIVLLNSGATR